MRTWRGGVLAVVLALVATACGGSDTPTDESTTSSAGADKTTSTVAEAISTQEAADHLIDRWGDRGAFFVVIKAMDLGYAPIQIIDYVDEILADGSIPGVDPDREPEGILSPTGPNGELPPSAFAGAAGEILGAPRIVFAQGDDDPTDAWVETADLFLSAMFDTGESWIAEEQRKQEEARRRAEDQAAADAEAQERFPLTITLLAMLLGERGYSARQITEGILLDSVTRVAPTLQDERPGLEDACFEIAGVQPEFDGITKPGCLAPDDPDFGTTTTTTLLDSFGSVFIPDRVRVHQPVVVSLVAPGVEPVAWVRTLLLGETAPEGLAGLSLGRYEIRVSVDGEEVVSQKGTIIVGLPSFDEPGTYLIEVVASDSGDEIEVSKEIEVVPALEVGAGLELGGPNGPVDVDPESYFGRVFVGETVGVAITVANAAEDPEITVNALDATWTTDELDFDGTVYRLPLVFEEAGEHVVTVRATDPGLAGSHYEQPTETMLTITVIDAPSDPNEWGGGDSCAGEGEGTEYGSQWAVRMTPPGDPASATWGADIYYHDCPNGGRLHYSGEVTLFAFGRWTGALERVDARGPLGGASGGLANPLDFRIMSGQSMRPNVQQELGNN